MKTNKKIKKIRLFITLLLLFAFFNCPAKDKTNQLSSGQQLTNSIGTEFYVTFHPGWEAESNNEYIIVVTSEKSNLVTIEHLGKNYFESKEIKPYKSVEFIVPSYIVQNYQKADTSAPYPDAIYRSFALYIKAVEPISVYCLSKFAKISDGYLALPVSSLSNKYVVTSSKDISNNNSQWLPGYTSIISAFDNTDVTFSLAGNDSSQTAGGIRFGTSKTVTLNKGDVWLIASKGQDEDLSGSLIEANLPVAVVSGNYCTTFEGSDFDGCSYTVEMEIPDYCYGKKYHLICFPQFQNSYVRITSFDNSNNIIIDGVQQELFNIDDDTERPTFTTILELNTTVPHTILSDKEIVISQYNASSKGDTLMSAPFQISLIPVEQYSNEMIFNIPNIFDESNNPIPSFVTFILESPDEEIPDCIEFGQEVNSMIVWEKLNAMSVETKAYPPFENENTYLTTTLELPAGTYKLRSCNNISAYQYNPISSSTYGFPVAVSMNNPAIKDTIPPKPVYTKDCNGNIFDGIIKDYPDNDTLRSNLGLIIYHSSESENYIFSYDYFIPGQSISTAWRLNVVNETKYSKAVITFIDRESNDTTITLEYYPVLADANPKLIDFGLNKINHTEFSQTIWIKNQSTRTNYHLTKIEFEKNKYFRLEHTSLPRIIAPSDSFAVVVKFNPKEAGAFKDFLVISDTCNSLPKIAISAEVEIPIITVYDVKFPDVTVDKELTRDLEINNSGNNVLLIYGIIQQKENPFNLILDRIPTFENPIEINPKENFTIPIKFSPKSEGFFGTTFIIQSDAQGLDSIATVTGRGIKPGLIATSYNWGKKRINLPEKPVEPYLPDDANAIIKLENNGSQSVMIYSLEIQFDMNGSSFLFDKSKFVNLKINPSESIVIPVTFLPSQVGEHKLVIRYINSANSITETTLEGIGIIPTLRFDDVSFDTTFINDFEFPVTKKVRIENILSDYSDTATIEDFSIFPTSDAISNILSQYGTQGFSFDKAAINLPRKIAPGEVFEFDATFVANKEGNHSAKLETRSNASSDVSSNWTGYGKINQSIISTQTNKTYICPGNTDTIYCKIQNKGDGNLLVSNLSFYPVIPEFSLSESIRPFQLHGKEERVIKVIFQPITTGAFSTNLVVENNSINDQTANIEVYGESSQSTKQISFNFNQSKIFAGQELYAAMALNTNAPIPLYHFNSILFTFSFNNDLLEINPDDIKLSANSENLFTLNIEDFNLNKGKFIFSLKPKSEESYISASELLFLKFYTSTNITNNISTQIKFDIDIDGSNCFNLQPISSTLSINPISINEIRKISGSAGDNSFNRIYPNPLQKEQTTDIEFTLAQSGMTYIQLYNEKGELLRTVFSGNLDFGKYKLLCSFFDLSAGAYFIRLSSNSFTETQAIILY